MIRHFPTEFATAMLALFACLGLGTGALYAASRLFATGVWP